MLGRGTSPWSSKAPSSGLTQDVEDVQVRRRCLATGTSLLCVVALVTGFVTKR